MPENDDWKQRLIKCLSRLDSTHDGEVLNAARAAARIMADHAGTWETLIGGSGADYDLSPQEASLIDMYRTFINSNRKPKNENVAFGIFRDIVKIIISDNK